MSLTLVEPPPAISGLPEWIERSLNVKAGRDPLGLQTITQDRITPMLLPAILVNSSRARYFSFAPFLLLEFEERRLPASNDVLSEFIKQREFEFAVAVQLCPRGCGAISAGNVGKDNAVPALNDAVDELVPVASRSRPTSAATASTTAPRSRTSESSSRKAPSTVRKTRSRSLR